MIRHPAVVELLSRPLLPPARPGQGRVTLRSRLVAAVLRRAAPSRRSAATSWPAPPTHRPAPPSRGSSA